MRIKENWKEFKCWKILWGTKEVETLAHVTIL